MKKLVLSALMLTVLSPAWAQAAPRRASGSQATAPAESAKPVLRDIAKALASALTDPESRRLIKREVGRKFDGDHEVLYRDVANRRVGNGKAFRQALGQSLGRVHGGPDTPANRVTAQQSLDQLTASLPQLQIAVPVGFTEWDADTAAPLVTYVPEGVDDDELVEVEAFDAQGRSYMLDARVEPAVPVVVVGLNERTDANGYLDTDLQQATGSMMMEQPIDEFNPEPPYEPADPGGDNPYEPVETVVTPPALGICDARTHNYGDQEIFYQIKINDDHEPWIKGDPEIYATYSFVDNQGIKGQYHMANVNNTGTWYTINGPLFYWQSYYGNTLAVAIWEKDGTNFGTFSYSFSGFTFSVQIFDGDDQLGGNPVSFFDPVCGYYSTGDAEYKMRY